MEDAPAASPAPQSPWSASRHDVVLGSGRGDVREEHRAGQELVVEYASESESEVEEEVVLAAEGLDLPSEHRHVAVGPAPGEAGVEVPAAALPKPVKLVHEGLLDRLPIHDFEREILDRVRRQRVAVICGETGCGKSTAIGPFLILDALTRGISRPRIVVAQPRRVAAVRLAERVDAQLKELAKKDKRYKHPETGKRFTAGYRIMADSSTDRGSSASVLFATTGYLVSWIAADPSALDDATHVVLDEAHERSVDMDLLLLLVRRRLAADPSSGFKLVIMSATLDVGLHGAYFSAFMPRPAPGAPDPAEPVEIAQRRYPVERIFLEQLLTHPLTSPIFDRPSRDLQMAYQDANGLAMEPWASREDMAQRLARFAMAVAGSSGSNYLPPGIDDGGFRLGVALALQFGRVPFQAYVPGELEGEEFELKSTSVLVFLPGENEILAFLEALEEGLSLYVDRSQWGRVRTHVLHSSTAREEQDRAFVPADKEKGEVKIVLATNIAESSITMPDAEYVIDYGLRRAMEFNANRGMQQLALSWISRASFKQRSGRVGRCSPGTYVALFSEAFLTKVCREHEPPEIAQITIEGVVLRVKETFPGERARELLNELVEPPSSDQLAAAFAKLKENGALLPLSSDARKAVRKATEIPGAVFADARRGTEAADAVDAEEGIVTFLGRVFPTIGAELNQVTLLLLAAAAGCAAEGAVLAAALSAQDVFSQPVPTFIKDRNELQEKLAFSFAGRLTADGGSLSEPIGLFEAFCAWADTPPGQRRGLLFQLALHQQRFRHFRAMCSTFALRLAHVLEKFVLLDEGARKRPARPAAGIGGESAAAASPEDYIYTKKQVNRLRALAKVAYETDVAQSDRRKLFEELGAAMDPEGGEPAIVPLLFAATRDQMRALLLACCAPNVFQGRPSEAPMGLLSDAAAKLERHRRWALGIGEGGPKKPTKEMAGKLLGTELLGEWNETDAAKDANNAKLGMLRNFTYAVPQSSFHPRPLGEAGIPGLAKKGGRRPVSAVPPAEVSFSEKPRFLASLRARYRDVDPRHTVVITLTEKCPPNMRSADAIRSALAWLGADRAVMCQTQKGRKVVPAVVVEFDPSASWGTEPKPDAEDPDSIFHPANQSGYGARMANYLCMGRHWALALPLPETGFAGKNTSALSSVGTPAMNLGHDVGAIALPGAFNITSANPVHTKMQLRCYWRCPGIYGLASFRLTEGGKVHDKPAPNADALLSGISSPVTVLHRSRGVGRPVYLVAGAVMAVVGQLNMNAFAQPATLNISSCTVVPADDPAWNLRLLALAPDPKECYLRMRDPASATAVLHPYWDCGQGGDFLRPSYALFPPAVRPTAMAFDAMLVRETLGAEDRTLRKEDLDAVNAVRASIRNLLIRGVGLSTAGQELGKALFDGIDAAARRIVASEFEFSGPSGAAPGEGGPYYAKLAMQAAAVPDIVAGMASAWLGSAPATSIPGDFKFTFDSSAALVSGADSPSRGLLPDAAALAIEQAFMAPLAWPKWDPPKPIVKPKMPYYYPDEDDEEDDEEDFSGDDFDSDNSDYY
ncbi:hypothetical protein DFJ74DRAFT_771616 [Hyaloraphidium curvatum]|nr:hypothetical protein DFJ74DRAFT_771616 [Hyaloraphidium curvatum]